MTELELILTSLGEAVTRTVAINTDAKGFDENKTAAIKGGKTAGEARERVEDATGVKVVSAENFLPKPKETSDLPSTPSEPKGSIVSAQPHKAEVSVKPNIPHKKAFFRPQ